MSFSPARVIARLLSSYTPDFSPPTRKEIAIADAFKGLLQSATHSDVDCEEEEESLQVSLDESEDVIWTPDADDDGDSVTAGPSSQRSIFFDGKPISESTIRQAIAYYRGTDKGTRTLSCMTSRFTWIKTPHHMNLLRELEKKAMIEESKVQKFNRLSALLRERVLEAAEQALPLSYAVIRRMAVRLNMEHNLVEGFKASKSWTAKFRYIRRIHEYLMHSHPDFAFNRDNILKIVSQTYRQFCAPRFRPCLAYAWVAAGYVDDHPGPFCTPTDYGFSEGNVIVPCQDDSGCSSWAFVRCSWCSKCLCFDCFIDRYHNC